MLQRKLARSEKLLNPLSVPQGGRGQQQGIDAVEDAAVAGKHGARILHPGAALDRGLNQIAHLGEDIQHHRQPQPASQRTGIVEDAAGQNRGQVDQRGGDEQACRRAKRRFPPRSYWG